MLTFEEKWEEISKTVDRLKKGGGTDEIEKVHQKGKLTARERIQKLIDPGTFQEIDIFKGAYMTGFDLDKTEAPCDAVITGYGRVYGRPVYVWAQDATVLGGSMASSHLRKIVTLMEKALRERVPIVGIYDSEGMRAQDIVQAHGHFSPGAMMYFQTLSSGVIPQISLVMGNCKGISAISARLADIVIMVKESSFMRAAPNSYTWGESISNEKIGDSTTHARKSGSCDLLAENDEDCMEKCRLLLGLLPKNNEEKAPIIDNNDSPERTLDDIMKIVPADSRKVFDMREVIKRVVDNGFFLEIQPVFAHNLTTALARLDGRTVGIIANNPAWKAGCLDVDTSGKHARFTRFCDAFNIPLIYFSDCPAFLPSSTEERRGILRHGCMVIHATSEATVPKINVIVRRLYGGACLVMPINFTKADRYISWPTVERGTMGAPALARITYLGKMKRAETEEEKNRIYEEGLKLMEKRVMSHSLETNEDIIDPRDTRKFLINALNCTEFKKQTRPSRKHDNMNL
ncbi:MAG: carboxyl transferase domain-containing protein [Spirochaetota bacterium]|nr:carboxyl transferase domain-containing protein [Spirochaetota bacterium]